MDQAKHRGQHRSNTGTVIKKFVTTSLRLSGIAVISVTTFAPARPSWASSKEGTSRGPAFASGPEVLRAQIQNDVMGAIEKNRSAKTTADYGASGYTAKDVFSNVRELRDPNGWVALCQTLDALTPDNLALFESEIQKPEGAKQMPCITLLRERLTRYWLENSARLRQHIAEISKKPRTTKTLGTSGGVDERKISVAESPVVTRDEIKENEIALTFNDGPHATRTTRILEILKAAGVRATFFHVGESIRARPEIVHRLVDEKHTLGTHSFTHPDLNRIDLKKAEKQIVKGREEAEAATGVDAPFFRPPYGLLNDEVREILKKRKMPVLLSNIDSQDWKIREVSDLFDRILQSIEKEKGGVLVMHETNEQTVLVLRVLIDELKARGYTFVVFVPGN